MSNIPEGLSDRFAAAIEAQTKHITVARVLINQALKILNSSDAKQALDVDDLVKATACLEKGTKMETRANAELIKLTKEKPRP
jgi:hypothetical protein